MTGDADRPRPRRALRDRRRSLHLPRPALGPDELRRRGADLETLASRIQGKSVIFLGLDRFAAYWLRGTLVQSPGGYVPPEVKARSQKPWPGPGDRFRHVSPHKLDATATRSRPRPFQSTPPPNFHRVATAGDYVLWKRRGDTARSSRGGRQPRRSSTARTARPAWSRSDRATARTQSGPSTARRRPAQAGRRGPVGWSQPLPFERARHAPHELRPRPGGGACRSSTTRRCRSPSGPAESRCGCRRRSTACTSPIRARARGGRRARSA